MIEGNTPAVWDGRVFDDVLAVTPAGDTYIGSKRKILGFGVDLDAGGNPVFMVTQYSSMGTIKIDLS